MPVCLGKTTKNGKPWYRVVECDTGKIVKRGGSAVDGGGSSDRSKVVSQVHAINQSMRKKH